MSEVVDGDVDRLVTIAVHAVAGATPGPDWLTLAQPAGRLPEGVPLRRGMRGLFLWNEGSISSEFPHAQGTFVLGGFLPGELDSSDRAAFSSLYGSTDWSAETENAARILLSSDNESGRQLALGWLRMRTELPDSLRSLVREGIEIERCEMNLASWLELLALREITLESELAARALLQAESSELRTTAMEYLQEHASVPARAALWSAYKGADTARKALLLEAFGRLDLEEADVWWERAIRDDDPRVVRTALESLATTRRTGLFEVYESLLTSTESDLRLLAVKALGRLADPPSIGRLRALATGDTPEGRLARQVLEHPRRFAGPRR